MREFGPGDPAGTDLRWSARFGPDGFVQSYRAYKQEWHANPSTIPSLVVEYDDGDGCSTGYVSWNGATDVEAWVIFEGRSGDQLEGLRRVGFEGFETMFAVDERLCVQVAAVGFGRLTRSEVVCPGT